VDNTTLNSNIKECSRECGLFDHALFSLASIAQKWTIFLAIFEVEICNMFTERFNISINISDP
jgi:hypothetical protein